MKAPGRTRSMLVATVVALVALTTVAATVIFGIARDTEEVVGQGTTAILAETTLSAATAAQDATAQMQIVAEAAEPNAASIANTEAGIARAEAALEEFQRSSEQLRAELGDTATRERLRSDSDALAVSAVLAIAQVRLGALESSAQTVAGDLATSYDAVVDTLVTIRNDASATFTSAGDDAARLADAARFFVVLLIPILILIAYRNHTRRIRRQQELERALEQEKAVSRTKSNFIAELSDQLRTPLAGIYGSALELRKPAIGSNAELSTQLATLITGQSAALATLVENTLTVATEDQGQLTIDLREIDPVTEIVGVLESLDAVGHTTNRDLEPGAVIADPRYLRQVVSNLASNAHRYGQKPVEVRSGISGDDYVIEVIDSGDGVDAEAEARLSGRYDGAGTSPLAVGNPDLGLSVAEILVSRMGGAIGYGRRDGKTVFTVWLPRA